MTIRIVQRSRVGLATPEPNAPEAEALRVALVRRAAASPDAVALRWKRRGRWQTWTWDALNAEVARAVNKLGASGTRLDPAPELHAHEDAPALPGDLFRAIATLRSGGRVVLHGGPERGNDGERLTPVSAAQVLERANTLPPLAYDERVSIALLEPPLSLASLCHGLGAAIVHRYSLHVPESARSWARDLAEIEPHVLLGTGAAYARLHRHVKERQPPLDTLRGRWLAAALEPLDPRDRDHWLARLERRLLLAPLRRTLGLARARTALWVTDREASTDAGDRAHAGTLLSVLGIDRRIAGERFAAQGALNLV